MAEVAAGKEIVRNVFVFTGKGGSQVIKGTRPAIIKKLKSLGINNPQLRAVQRQVMANKNVRTIGVSQITANLMNKLTAGKLSGLGKIPGGPGNLGMKPDELAKSKLETKPKTVFNKKKASTTTTTNQKKASTTTTNQKKVESTTKKTDDKKADVKKKPEKITLTADKKNKIIQEVQKKNPNATRAKILNFFKTTGPAAAKIGRMTSVLGIASVIATSIPFSKIDKDTLKYGVFFKDRRKKRIEGTKSGVPLGPNRPKQENKAKPVVKEKPKERPKEKPIKQSQTGGSFKDAFATARKNNKQSFTFQGKKYAAVTASEVKKAGFKNLREYLNAKGKKPKKLSSSVSQR